MLFRSLTVGLVGACLLLILALPRSERIVERPVLIDRTLQIGGTQVVDIAPNLTTAQLVEALRLAPDERLHIVDHQVVRDDIEAGARLAAWKPEPGKYLELVVSSPMRVRRIVALVD